jgi:hypothetical protein
MIVANPAMIKAVAALALGETFFFLFKLHEIKF